MENYSSDNLRKAFISFFEGKDHLSIPSASLIPQNDDSLLVINSGMAPLKAYFTGQETPPSKRIVNYQKCIRTNDIENVGKTDRHGSMFEMLGNFSFGDYFKKEAIEMAWEFLHDTLKIPYEILSVSVYEADDEAYDLWVNHMNLPPEKVFPLGKEENFWEVGVGPCGPCSEIFVDRGKAYGCESPDCSPGCDCDRFMEVWNLVFTQYFKEEDGSYTELKQKNIDTGMGLERLAMFMQEAPSFFDIDSMGAIKDTVTRLASYVYGTDAKKDISVRVITDHIRSVTFMVADGILPSNEGRGYVLRRLLRRALRHGRQLGISQVFLSSVATTVIQTFAHAYPELKEKESYVLKLIAVEEERFNHTIDQGIILLGDIVKQLQERKKDTFPGHEAFRLYDTFGFPLELLQEILAEEAILVDERGFTDELEKQRQRARDARAKSTYMGSEDTVFSHLDMTVHSQFVGHHTHTHESTIVYLLRENEIVEAVENGEEISLIVPETPFYPESGGQVGDQGIITTDTGEIEIYDTQYVPGDKIIHIGKVVQGTVKTGQFAQLAVDETKRLSTARNHSATHLLHRALQEVLGDHVEQAGSLVSPTRLRFDFTHFSPLSTVQWQQIIRLVNGYILEADDIHITITDIETARGLGAMALFGEKYGQEVRVVQMGDSIELCGGTHVDNTAKIGAFAIIAETGIAAGVRRLECLTGMNTLDYMQNLEKRQFTMARLLKTNPEELIARLENNLELLKTLHGEIDSLKDKQSLDVSSSLLENMAEINGINVLTAFVKEHNMDDLKALGDQLKNEAKSIVLTLVGEKDEQLFLLIMATDDLVDNHLVHAGNMVKVLAPMAEGKGGGRPNMAQAGLVNKEKIQELLRASEQWFTKE